MHRPQGGESWCLNLVGGGVKEEKGGVLVLPCRSL